jgi:ribosomal protein S18 acetylase RimI-like enzyme
MAPNNTKAFHFYKKLGFTVLSEESGTLWLGKKLA